MNNLFIRGLINSGIAVLYFFNYGVEMYKTGHTFLATISFMALVASVHDIVIFYKAPELVAIKKDTKEEG